jgi:Right handed beta helix region
MRRATLKTSKEIVLNRVLVATAVAALGAGGAWFTLQSSVFGGQSVGEARVGSTTIVSTPAQLESAVANAKDGETITLKPGVYPQIVIAKAHFARAVTFTSMDPEHAAVLAGLKIRDSSGLVFDRLELTTIGSDDNYAASRIQDSQQLTFSHMNVHGDVSGTPGDQLQGFYILASSNVTVSGSDFHHLRAALVESRDDGLKVVGNEFHDLSKGGVEMVGDSDVTISDNVFTNFQTSAKVHGDAIQIFTTGSTASAHDLTIERNLIYRGSGVPAQGIFVTDEIKKYPYHNVTIDDNAIIGDDWNSICLSRADGAVHITRNIVASWTGTDVVKGGTTNFIGWIRVDGIAPAGFVETGNRAQAYLYDGKAVGISPAGNVTMGAVGDAGAGLIRAWAAAHSQQISADLHPVGGRAPL